MNQLLSSVQANKLLEAKIDMLRANLQAARTHADSSGGEDGAELQKLKNDLSKATRQIAELQETAELFKDQQSASVQAAAALQAEVPFWRFNSPDTHTFSISQMLCILLKSSVF